MGATCVPGPFVTARPTGGKSASLRPLPPLFNVLVSNVAGPDFALWCAGARLVALYPVGPIIEGVGLNVTVASYEGTLYVGILGCRELVPEVAHFGDLLADSFAELVKAAERNGGHWA